MRAFRGEKNRTEKGLWNSWGEKCWRRAARAGGWGTGQERGSCVVHVWFRVNVCQNLSRTICLAFCRFLVINCSLRCRELGDGLGAFRDGVLGQLSGKEEANSGLDLSGSQGVLLVVANKLAGLGGDLVEQVVDEGVHHGHAAGGDAGVGVDLLQHLVDVGGVRLFAGLALLHELGGKPAGSELHHLGNRFSGSWKFWGHCTFSRTMGTGSACLNTVAGNAWLEFFRIVTAGGWPSAAAAAP
jgi:hypothetical protein